MTPFGDHAVRFAAPALIGERRALLHRLRALPGVRDVVLCEEVGCVVFEDGAERALVADALASPIDAEAVKATRRVVRVVYDGQDLDAVAATVKRSREDVIRMHGEGDYVVAMLGFLPGFAYLRGLAPELVLPRRAPRPRVPPRSVAIGADYTGIYPVASAGGWHLLGRAEATPQLELGDRVCFEAVASIDEPTMTRESAPEPRGAHLVVTRIAGLALFVDDGRAGQMHRGMPPGGPLVRSAFERALVSGRCAIELTGVLEVEARGGAVTLAGGTLREGERFTLASTGRRVAYLAIEGGFDAPVIEGSRNALLSAGIGRPLRRGDTLCAGSAPVVRLDRFSSDDLTGPIALRVGPDLTAELRSAIEDGAFTISPTSDRAGTRLVGPALPVDRATRASTPMVEGAVELTPSGLVVLGPDHPTTGGYPVPALLAATSRDDFFGRPLGAPVRFTFGE